MQTLKDAIEISQEYDEGKHDFVSPSSLVYFENGQVMIDDGQMHIAPYNLEDGAMSQLCQKLDIPYKYARRCPDLLRDQNFNHWTKNWSGRDWFIRTHNDSVRAVLSSQYVPVSSTEILQAADAIVGDANYKLLRPYVGRDEIHMRITVLDDIGPDGNYGVGAYIANGETGNRQLVVAPFLQRTSCTNSTIWMEQAWQHKHIKHSDSWLLGTMKEYLSLALNLADEMVEKIVGAEMDKIPDFMETVHKLAKKHGLSEQEENLIFSGSENNWSRMGVVNGLTFMAQATENLDRQIQMESLAGSILADPQSLFGRAVRQRVQADALGYVPSAHRVQEGE